MKTLEALRGLVALLTGKSESSVTGDTVDKVIEYGKNNLSVTATGLALKDTAGDIWDISISTAGVISGTKRTAG